jgi:hypothetical protein
MSSWAKPGVKCVCIRTAPLALRVAGANYPEVGVVYTVRKVVITSFGPHKGEPSLLLEEVVNTPAINPRLFPDVHSPLEASMPVDAFRPLITRTQEQDIALFHHLLSPSPADVGLIPAGVELVE